MTPDFIAVLTPITAGLGASQRANSARFEERNHQRSSSYVQLTLQPERALDWYELMLASLALACNQGCSGLLIVGMASGVYPHVQLSAAWTWLD